MHRSSAVWESRKMLGNVQVFIGKYISHPLLFMEFLPFKHIYAVQLAVICLSELIFRLIILLPLEIFGHRVDPERALKSVASFQTGSIVFGIVSLFLAIIFCPFSWPVCLPVFVTYFISRLWCIVSIFIISLYIIYVYCKCGSFALKSVPITNDGATSFHSEWCWPRLRQRSGEQLLLWLFKNSPSDNGWSVFKKYIHIVYLVICFCTFCVSHRHSRAHGGFRRCPTGSSAN